MTSQITLILGGTGKIGRRVTDRLSVRGLPVRIGSRSSTPTFDWEDQSTWARSVKSVHAAYVTYSPDLAFPGAAEKVETFANLAVKNGVRRLVLLSGRNEEGAQRAEAAVRDSGAEWTIVRSSFFHQNFSEGFWLDSVLSGELAVPAGYVSEPFVDADDVADIVVAALTENKHVGQLYEVTGPRLLTFADVAAEIANVSGRKVRYVPVSTNQFKYSLMESGLPAEFATNLTDLFANVLDGRGSYLTKGVERVLDRKPRDFRNYARDVAAAGIWRGIPGRTVTVPR